MRLWLAIAIAPALGAGAYACSDSYSDEGAPSDASVGDGTAATPDSASDSPTDGPSDAGSESAADSASGNSGDIFDDGFESDVSSCVGWVPGSVTAQITNAYAHNGSNSCMVCLTASANIGIGRDLSFDASAGPFELDLFMMSLNDAGITGVGNVAIYSPSTEVGGSNASTALQPGQWVPLQIVTSATAPGDSVDFGFYIQPETAGDCFYFDDVRFFVQH